MFDLGVEAKLSVAVGGLFAAVSLVLSAIGSTALVPPLTLFTSAALGLVAVSTIFPREEFDFRDTIVTEAMAIGVIFAGFSLFTGSLVVLAFGVLGVSFLLYLPSVFSRQSSTTADSHLSPEVEALHDQYVDPDGDIDTLDELDRRLDCAIGGGRDDDTRRDEEDRLEEYS